MATINYNPNTIIINRTCTLVHGFRLLLLLICLSFPMAASQPPNNTDDTGNVSPSMAVIVIVLVLAFFITGIVSIYIHQCGDSSAFSAAPIVIAGAGDGRSRRGSVRGLEKSTIDTFPTFLYSSVKELKIGKGSLECAVCLNEFEDEETLRLLPKCDHVFHPDCIDAWLANHTTCPVCRANLVPEAEKIGNSLDSTHGMESNGEIEASSSGEEINQRCECEVRITINDEGTTSEDAAKRNASAKFPRSHSTGHSLCQPGEDLERFTLRLPLEVRTQLVARVRMKRSTSVVALPRASSSPRGYRNGDGEGSGSSRYGRIFSRFLLPIMGSKVVANVDETAGSVGSKWIKRTAVTPLESLPPLSI